MSSLLRLATGLLFAGLLAAPARGAERAPNAPDASGPNRAQATTGAKVLNGFRYEVLVMGETPEPLALQFCPDGRLWFTGRRGQVWAYDFPTRKHHLVGELKVCWEPTPGREANERGLHGIAFDPGYRTNGWVYLHYAPWAPTNATAWSNRVSRFTVRDVAGAAGLDPASEKILLTIPSLRGFHQGGALGVHPVDGHLYITSGDNNVSSDTEKFWNDPANPPQVLSALQGKVLRIARDGSIPADNPFVGRREAHPAVFTYGHRNPYSLNIDRVTGQVFVGEIGYDRPVDWEEVNLLKAGGNYGWPRCMGTNAATFGGGPCPQPDAIPPLIAYNHDNNAGGNAGGNATSGPRYRPTGTPGDFPAKYHGGVFYADWVRKWIRFGRMEGDRVTGTEPFLRGTTGGVIAMEQGPDGALYLLEYAGWFTPSGQDKLSRIVWTGKMAGPPPMSGGN